MRTWILYIYCCRAGKWVHTSTSFLILKMNLLHKKIHQIVIVSTIWRYNIIFLTSGQNFRSQNWGKPPPNVYYWSVHTRRCYFYQLLSNLKCWMGGLLNPDSVSLFFESEIMFLGVMCVFNRHTILLVLMAPQVEDRRSTCSCGTLQDRRGSPAYILYLTLCPLNQSSFCSSFFCSFSSGFGVWPRLFFGMRWVSFSCLTSPMSKVFSTSETGWVGPFTVALNVQYWAWIMLMMYFTILNCTGYNGAIATVEMLISYQVFYNAFFFFSLDVCQIPRMFLLLYSPFIYTN